MSRFAVEPMSFWVGMAMVFAGLVFYPSPYLVWQVAANTTASIGALMAFTGWFLLILSIAIGTSRTSRARQSDAPSNLSS